MCADWTANAQFLGDIGGNKNHSKVTWKPCVGSIQFPWETCGDCTENVIQLSKYLNNPYTATVQICPDLYSRAHAKNSTMTVYNINFKAVAHIFL